MGPIYLSIPHFLYILNCTWSLEQKVTRSYDLEKKKRKVHNHFSFPTLKSLDVYPHDDAAM